MASDEPTVELEPGDFVYQSDQELFLTVIDDLDDGYRFAVHGWREISNQRLYEYLEGEHGKLHKSDEIEQIIEEEADDETKENFDHLTQLFESYESIDTSEIAEDFALEDK